MWVFVINLLKEIVWNLYLLFLLFGSLRIQIQAHIINAYTKAPGINGAKTTLIVTNVNQASHTFTVCGSVIIMQMQYNVIGTNTSNVASFGDLGSIANAGVYKVGVISARSPAAGTATTITLISNGQYI